MTDAIDALAPLREAGALQLHPVGPRITVGVGTCGIAAGAAEVLAALGDELAQRGSTALLEPVGCSGRCYAEPLVEVFLPESERALFGGVEPQDVQALCDAIEAGSLDALEGRVAELRIDDDFDALQERRVLGRCGAINPRSIAEYVATGGYAALARALEMGPDWVIDEIEASGLRGRGGGGFPTGEKWRACAEAAAPEKFFIVNADEGDPGAYMDRGLLESDPHRILEGLIIGCFAIRASQGYFFIRAEYPLAVETVQAAIDDAYKAGLLGPSVMGSGFSLDVSIVRGAGAFLCGESTAMVSVLENGPCLPRRKPPHLSERGLWDAPTCLNNVETLANVPPVVEYGAAWFREVGTAESPGTKVFSLTGSVERTGLVEVPLGTPLGTLAKAVGQAPHPKAVQIGGPSGAIVPAALADLPLSFESLSGVNGMMGSGGFVVLGDDQCVVDVAAHLVRFSADQSCGRCRSCRDGLAEASLIFDRLVSGTASADDLERLRVLAADGGAHSLCGLGRTALSPVQSSLHYFPDEYEAHVEGRCPGLVCRNLVSYVIDEKLCQGERCCLLTCPGNAVKGRFGQAGHIVERLCQKCGMCMVTCPYAAVRKVSP